MAPRNNINTAIETIMLQQYVGGQEWLIVINTSIATETMSNEQQDVGGPEWFLVITTNTIVGAA